MQKLAAKANQMRWLPLSGYEVEGGQMLLWSKPILTYYTIKNKTHC